MFVIYKIFKGLFFNDLKRNRNLENIFSGRRCFIIGNGPSLTTNDLLMISDEITFGCNSFYKAKVFSPTVYSVGDPLKPGIVNYVSEILGKTDSKYYFIREEVYQALKATKFFNDRELPENLFKIKVWRNNYQKKLTAIDLENLVPGYRHTPILSIMLAIYMGCNEIVLLGLDHCYIKDYFKGMTQVSHFYEEDAEKKEVMPTMKAIDLYKEAIKTDENFIQILNLCERRGVKIVDATRGGCLDIFDRVDLEDLYE